MINKWSLANMCATITLDEERNKNTTTDAKIEIENFCNETNDNFIVEVTSKPSFWMKLSYYWQLVLWNKVIWK